MQNKFFRLWRKIVGFSKSKQSKNKKEKKKKKKKEKVSNKTIIETHFTDEHIDYLKMLTKKQSFLGLGYNWLSNNLKTLYIADTG